ncbi:hypothetical protein PUN28_002926 [Cardiocondyla obscurior]|uniref:Uncharacterized protein n=1 Tax=Cardiocondyla obscurior TaxID=286306 RepID=A0AAW2GWP7_9HYME
MGELIYIQSLVRCIHNCILLRTILILVGCISSVQVQVTKSDLPAASPDRPFLFRIRVGFGAAIEHPLTFLERCTSIMDGLLPRFTPPRRLSRDRPGNERSSSSSSSSSLSRKRKKKETLKELGELRIPSQRQRPLFTYSTGTMRDHWLRLKAFLAIPTIYKSSQLCSVYRECTSVAL